MRKVRPRDVRSFVPSPAFCKRRNWIQSPGYLLLCCGVFVNAIEGLIVGIFIVWPLYKILYILLTFHVLDLE